MLKHLKDDKVKCGFDHAYFEKSVRINVTPHG